MVDVLAVQPSIETPSEAHAAGDDGTQGVAGGEDIAMDVEPSPAPAITALAAVVKKEIQMLLELESSEADGDVTEVYAWDFADIISHRILLDLNTPICRRWVQKMMLEVAGDMAARIKAHRFTDTTPDTIPTIPITTSHTHALVPRYRSTEGQVCCGW